jgi:hypothetical protein
MSAPRTSVAILRALRAGITPGDWDAMGSHVASPLALPPAQGDDGRSDADSLRYYGGLLVCESCNKSDAAFIAAAHNLLPDLLDEFDALVHRVWDAEFRLRLAEASLADAEATIELERSRRYVAPLRPLERAGLVRIHHDNRVEVVGEIGASAACA